MVRCAACHSPTDVGAGLRGEVSRFRDRRARPCAPDGRRRGCRPAGRLVLSRLRVVSGYRPEDRPRAGSVTLLRTPVLDPLGKGFDCPPTSPPGGPDENGTAHAQACRGSLHSIARQWVQWVRGRSPADPVSGMRQPGWIQGEGAGEWFGPPEIGRGENGPKGWRCGTVFGRRSPRRVRADLPNRGDR
jgi:hypothetical protein